MPGSLCNGVDTDQPLINESHAYCEGFYARAESASVTNPYNPAETPIDWLSFNRGVGDCSALAGQTLTRADCACCAGEGLTVPTV